MGYKEIRGEYTNLYDENKNLTGKTLFREKGKKLNTPEGYFSVVVVAIIENSKNEFLLQKTSKNKNSVLAFTGGHVKAGQTSVEAIIDEIQEEMGIAILESELKLLKTYKYDNAFKDVFYIKKDINIEDLTYQEEEVESVKFYTKEELLSSKDNIRKTNIDIVEDFIEI